MKTLILLLFPLSLLAQVTVTKVSDSTYLLTVKPVIKTDTVWLPSLPQPAQGTLIYSINSGGPGDRNFTGGTAFARGNLPAPYNTERWGNLSYNLPANGRYEVVLKFAEIFHTAVNRRRFNVSVEGQPVKSNWDIFAEHGTDTVRIKTETTVIDGQLTITLQGVTDNAKISGFDVIRLDSIPFQTGGQIPDEPIPGATHRVTTTGSDQGNCRTNPCRTLPYAIIQMSSGDVLRVEGNHTLTSQLTIKSGTTVRGPAVLRGFEFPSPAPKGSGYLTEYYLLKMLSNSRLINITIDGEDRKLRGGVWVSNSHGVVIDSVSISECQFNAVWFWGSNNSKLLRSKITNCAWNGSWDSGAIQYSSSPNLEIAYNEVNTDRGYCAKNIGDTHGRLDGMYMHHNTFNSTGPSNRGIAVEFHSIALGAGEFSNNYINRNLSVVSDYNTGTFKIHNNRFDTRGVAIELSRSNCDINGNFFDRNGTGMVNWQSQQSINQKINNNVFYGFNPTGFSSNVVRGNNGNITGEFVGNTVDFSGGLSYLAGAHGTGSVNLTVKDNLIISNGNGRLSEQQGGTVSLTLVNNFFQGMTAPTGNVSGTAPIQRTGNRPFPYYLTGDSFIYGAKNVN